MKYTGLNLGFASDFSSLLTCTLGGIRWWLKHFHLSHLCEFLTSIWSSPDCCGHLENESDDKKSPSPALKKIAHCTQVFRSSTHICFKETKPEGLTWDPLGMEILLLIHRLNSYLLPSSVQGAGIVVNNVVGTTLGRSTAGTYMTFQVLEAS